jgi:hypothetical protein
LSDSDIYLEDEDKDILSDVNKEVLSIAKKLKDENYNPTIIVSSSGESEWYECYAPQLWKAAKAKGITVFDENDPYLAGHMNPRDSFVLHDNTLYLNSEIFKKKGVVKPAGIKNTEIHKWFWKNGFRRKPDWLNNIRWNYNLKSIDVVLSKFGEGGLWICLDDFIIASSHVKKRDKFFPKKKIYFMEPIAAKIGDKDYIPEDFRNHIDYHVNRYESDDISLLLVDPEFYQRNEVVFDKIAKSYGTEIIMVDSNERHFVPAGFLDLPDGRIMMTPDTPKTYGKLRDRIGNKIITTPTPIPNLLERLFSLRCATNVIYGEALKK